MTDTTETSAVLLTIAWWLPFCILLAAAWFEARASFSGTKGANGLVLVTSVSFPLVLALPLGLCGALVGDFGYGLAVMWQLLKATALAWGGMFVALWLLVRVAHMFGIRP